MTRLPNSTQLGSEAEQYSIHDPCLLNNKPWVGFVLGVLIMGATLLGALS